jgi:hypothetical protein
MIQPPVSKRKPRLPADIEPARTRSALRLHFVILDLDFVSPAVREIPWANSQTAAGTPG